MTPPSAFRPIPPAQFDAEVALVRHLVHLPPWASPNGDDRSLRAVYRRWTSTDGEPTPDMHAPLWRRVPAAGWRDLDDAGIDRAVHHAALVLHLVALGADTGPVVPDLGAAARVAGVHDGRFARLVNAPPSARLDALDRLFRHFARHSGGVRPRLTVPRPADGEDDARSTRATLRDTRRDDLAALLAFLFTTDPRPAVSRWAAGFFRAPSTADAASAADAPAA